MKKILITILLILSFSLVFSQTTEKEFNYIQKGYDYQMSMGLDVKKGVTTKTFIFIDDMYSGIGLRLNFIFFYKDNDSIPFGSQLKFYMRSKPKKIYTISIPQPSSKNQEVIKLFLRQFEFSDDFKYEKIRKQYIMETCYKVSNLLNFSSNPFKILGEDFEKEPLEGSEAIEFIED